MINVSVCVCEGKEGEWLCDKVSEGLRQCGLFAFTVSDLMDVWPQDWCVKD